MQKKTIPADSAKELKLIKLSNNFSRPGPITLAVLDGFGIGKKDPKINAIEAFYQNNPEANWLKLLSSKNSLSTQLIAHGKGVGLPSDDDMGNSEVGHNAIGAGRLVPQGAKIIQELIQSGEFYDLPTLKDLCANTLKNNSTLHLIGLLQTSGVHAHIDNLKAIVEGAYRQGVTKIRVHVLTDGRDDSPDNSIPIMKDLQEFLESYMGKNASADYKIASGGGRMWLTMDRYEADWKMVERGWNTHVHGAAEIQAIDPLDAIAKGRENTHTKNPDETDQYMASYVIVDENNEPIGKIKDQDSVIFFNHRGDRAIEISKAFEGGVDFDKFDRGRVPREVKYAGMMLYDGDANVPNQFLVAMPKIKLTMAEILAYNKLSSLAISETQKFGHMTYFLNGNVSGYFDPAYESYLEIPSDDSTLFASKPEMKAQEITSRIISEYGLRHYDYIRVNYPNGDMVGHTGNFEAVVKAIQALDSQLGQLMKFTEANNGILLVTADHGNADEMVKGGKPSNSHSLNKVPFVIYDPNYQGEYELVSIENPTLSNIASTLFNLGGFEKPVHMTDSLIKFLGK
jgi:2,3-bisphosphoglycerate-independent phosphoglycerate mutase